MTVQKTVEHIVGEVELSILRILLPLQEPADEIVRRVHLGMEGLAKVLTEERNKLKAVEDQLVDWTDSVKACMSEEAHDDEVHCTCVPLLRKQIKEFGLKHESEIEVNYNKHKRIEELEAEVTGLRGLKFSARNYTSLKAKLEEAKDTFLELKHNNHHYIEDEVWRIDDILKKI